MICKKCLNQRNFCVKRVAQITKSHIRVHRFITKWLHTSICPFKISVLAFIFIKVTKDCYSKVTITD